MLFCKTLLATKTAVLPTELLICVQIIRCNHILIDILFQGDENLNVLHHPPNFKGPILFSFNAKNFFGKKKASIRVQTGDWSDKFSLDVAGSSGVVHCKLDDMIYDVSMKMSPF